MIAYNPKSWFSLIFNFYSRYLIRTLYPMLLFMGAYAGLVCYLAIEHLGVSRMFLHVEILHSLLGLILGLFLVLRINTAYDRWWEGRKIWGNLVNQTRTLAMKVNAYLPEQATDDREFFMYMIPNFVHALKEHLRTSVRIEELDFQDKTQQTRFEKASHKVNALSTMIYERLQQLYTRKDITSDHLIILDNEARGLMDSLGACERIKNTPIPYSYSMYIKKFIFIYALTLPLALVVFLGYWTVLAVLLIFYILVSIELISEEIEDPFGTDVNDLPLEHLSSLIKLNVREIFSIDKSLKQAPRAIPEAVSGKKENTS